MSNIMQRTKFVLSGEDGMVLLEAVIICCAVCFLTAYLLKLLYVVMDFGVIRNGWTSSTGWFRTTDTTGIMNTH